ncbi:MAG TPA: hypothetical protein VKA48_01840, partial [Gammaproteobacteria bacterium]|nr:hypothetical protein [Gammaproteobacteria bacterium]
MRLFHQLERLEAFPVTWVAAAAGSGKSTLLSTFLRQGARPFLWVKLDPGDRDPASFFHFLALAAVWPEDPADRLPVPSTGYGQDPLAFGRDFFQS